MRNIIKVNNKFYKVKKKVLNMYIVIRLTNNLKEDMRCRTTSITINNNIEWISGTSKSVKEYKPFTIQRR